MKIESLLEALDDSKEKKKNKGFHIDIEKETITNNNFRKVLFTAPTLQLVVMSLKPREDIGLEVHEDDQFIRVDEGSGIAIIGDDKFSLKDGSAIIVPAGAKHNITAGNKGIKLYTVYGSNHHEDMVIHKTKKDDKE